MNEELEPDIATKLWDFFEKSHIVQRRIVNDVEWETVELDTVADLDHIFITSCP
jgi:hypothetical protein